MEPLEVGPLLQWTLRVGGHRVISCMISLNFYGLVQRSRIRGGMRSESRAAITASIRQCILLTTLTIVYGNEVVVVCLDISFSCGHECCKSGILVTRSTGSKVLASS